MVNLLPRLQIQTKSSFNVEKSQKRGKEFGFWKTQQWQKEIAEEWRLYGDLQAPNLLYLDLITIIIFIIIVWH